MSLFVTIEGIEGSGKSTLRSRIADLIPRSEGEVVMTREPGATPLGLSIRSLLLDPSAGDIDPLAELMLFAADRAQHLAELIRPALARGATVVCDRYVHSTLAYQGYGRGLPLDQLRVLNTFITAGLMPDLVLLLDLPPEAGLLRAKSRQERASGTFLNPLDAAQREDSWSRFEQQELEFHQRVRHGFLELAKDVNNRIVVIDAGQDPEQVAAVALKAINDARGARTK